MNNTGYYKVTLSKRGVHKDISIHKLVALHFLRRTPGTVVNHKNGIKADNHVKNLEWVTPKENAQHSWLTGLSKLYPGQKLKARKLGLARRLFTKNQIRTIRGSTEKLGQLATIYRVNPSTITRIKSRLTYKKIK